MTEPTDNLQQRCAEIVEWQRTGVLSGSTLRNHAKTHWAGYHDSLQMAERDTLTKAVEWVAKWGTPPAVAGEPCGWAMFRPDGSMVHGSSENSAEACLFALSESEVACGQKPGYMAATKGWKPQPIYATPQPTQAQAGAVPLTDEQIEALPLWKRFVGLWPETRREIVRTIERHHGITGGQQ